MSTLRVSSINNAAASVGGLAIDSSGNVTGALPAPNRNLLYNGAMQVSQRGTSTTGITDDGFYTADRWNFVVDTMGTWTQTVENDAPTGSGFRKSLKVLCTTADAAPAAADLVRVQQVLEGQDLQRIAKGTSSAQKVTLSFWVKSNVTGTYVAALADIDNTRYVGATYSVSASATWEKKTITFPADTTGAFDNDNNLSLRLNFWLGAGTDRTSGTLPSAWESQVNANIAAGQTNVAAATNNYWQITGVQLEVGDAATDFEFKSYGQELRECQRYYYVLVNGTNQMMGTGYAFSATDARISVKFPTTMRIAPNLVATSGTNYYSCQSAINSADLFDTVLDGGVTSVDTALIYANANLSLTAGYGVGWWSNNASSRVAFNAEL